MKTFEKEVQALFDALPVGQITTAYQVGGPNRSWMSGSDVVPDEQPWIVLEVLLLKLPDGEVREVQRRGIGTGWSLVQRDPRMATQMLYTDRREPRQEIMERLRERVTEAEQNLAWAQEHL